MYNFGKHILKYLHSNESKHSMNVIESNILDAETSYQLFCSAPAPAENFRQRLFYNPNITIDFIKAHIGDTSFLLDVEKTSFSSLITQKEVMDHSELNNIWNIYSLIQNPKMCPSFVLSRYRESFLSKPQSYINRCVLFNRSSSLHLFRNLKIQLSEKDILYYMSCEKIMMKDFELLIQNIQNRDENFLSYEPSIYRLLSKNKNLNIQYITKHPDKPWDWYSLSENPAFSMQDVVRSTHLPWKHSHLSINPRLTIADVLKYKEFEWNYNYLCINKNISIIDLEKLPGHIFLKLFHKKFIYMNEYWDIELFEKYNKMIGFTQQNINLMFFAKKSWIKNAYLKKKQLDVYYDELMAQTWKPSRLENWIWDTEQLKEWYLMPE
jgi:hypothetical protein